MDQVCLVGDLADKVSMHSLQAQYKEIDRPAEVFIHCAGLAHKPVETTEVQDQMWAVNDTGTANVLSFCERVGIKRFVYVSTIAGYDWDHVPANEDHSSQARTEYAKSKLAGERRVLNANLDGRVVRLATVFGTGDKANFLKLSGALKRKRFVIPGDGSARKSVIPVDLAARLITEFARLNNPKHKMINLALPDAPTLKEICDSFSSVCEFPRAPSVSLPILRLLARCGDLASRIRPLPLNTSVIDKLTTSTWVDTQRMQEILAPIPEVSFASGLRRHSDYYRNA
jgi:nucleoside-diphosphate-sugar epimerase